MKKSSGYFKRFYYTPGIISLILLPALCIWYLYDQRVFEKYNALVIVWSGPGISISPNIFPLGNNANVQYTDIHFNTNDVFGTYNNKDSRYFTNINFIGNIKMDELNLETAQLEIRNMITSKDTIQGVHLHFSDGSKYETWIKAIDICQRENAKLYIPHENDLWIYYFEIDTSYLHASSVTGSGCLITDPLLPAEKSNELTKKERDKKIKYIKETAKKYSVSGILFLLMSILTIRKFYKGNQT